MLVDMEQHIARGATLPFHTRLQGRHRAAKGGIVAADHQAPGVGDVRRCPGSKDLWLGLGTGHLREMWPVGGRVGRRALLGRQDMTRKQSKRCGYTTILPCRTGIMEGQGE